MSIILLIIVQASIWCVFGLLLSFELVVEDFDTYRSDVGCIQSDILEEDEMEIDIGDILPPSPTLEQSSASTRTARSTLTLEEVGKRLKNVLRKLSWTVRSFFLRFLSSSRTQKNGQNIVSCFQLKHHQDGDPTPVLNDGTKGGLDLLA